MNPQDLERAMAHMKLTQENVVKNLEKTIELLKQIKMEEKIASAAERAADMARKQLELNDALSRTKDPAAMKNLSKSEQEIQKMSQEQQAALDSLAAELQKMDEETAQDAENQRDRLQGLHPEFQQSSEQMEQAMRKEAQEST